METVMNSLGILRRLGQKLGPYLMLEMLLPGGTLLALLLFLYRRRNLNIRRLAQRIALAVACTLTSIVEQRMLVLRPCYLRPSQALRPTFHHHQE